MTNTYTRREMLRMTGKVILAGALLPHSSWALDETSSHSFGAIAGDPVAVKYGEEMLANGGNAIDAAITAGLAACMRRGSGVGIPTSANDGHLESGT